MIALIPLLALSAAGQAPMTEQAPAPAPSAFTLACISSGGTAGTAKIGNGNSRALLYSGPSARLSLSFAPADGVFFIQLAVREPSPGEPNNPTINPGEGRILVGSRMSIESMGGTVGKGVEYCLRPI